MSVRPRPTPPIRLFESPLLERLSRTHPAVPGVVWGPAALWLAWRAVAVGGLGGPAATGLAASGLVTWTLAEYLLHRFVFHFRPQGAWQARLHLVIHGVHHDAPDDARRQLMPPVPAALALVVLYGVSLLLLGAGRCDAFFTGFLVGYLAYDYIHYGAHQGLLPTRAGRALRRWHLRHHHADPESRWGVSSPLWDYVFRTTGTPARPAIRRSKAA